jgi:UvrD-like helicase C-terminal domain/PD-(D/E)XK nuclease superfamily
MTHFAMPLDDVGAVLATLRDDEREPLDWLDARRGLPISADGHGALDRLAEALKGFDADTPPWRTLTMILLDRTRIAATIAVAQSVGERSQGIALWQLMNFLRVQPREQGKAVPRLLDRIKRLVAIGDDRDLRQLPAAAQGLDAVRLMTIHGAKGLEFRCVHLPGLNQDTLPSPSKAPACLPPDGVIAGLTGDVKTALRDGDAEERECLFYVALSRARDRLVMYAATEKANHAARPLSEFLDRLGTGVARSTPDLIRKLPPAPEDEPITLVIDGTIRLRDSQVAMLDKDKCKRRFFYTHVLGIGGRRTETDYMRMHEAARSVVRAAVRDGLDLSDDAQLRAAVERACDDHGLDTHGSCTELRAMAITLVTRFRQSRLAHRAETPAAVPLSIGANQIVFSADDVLVDAKGVRIYRRIRTGAYRKSDIENLGVATALLALAENAPGAAAEVVHLMSDRVSALDMTARVLGNRRELLDKVITGIRDGSFPASPSQRVCPGCPAFFICGPVPGGSLQKVF